MRRVLDSGEVIEDYLHDKPLEAKLLLGWTNSHPLHVVAAHDPTSNRTIIVTVYVPDARHWEADFKTRKL